MKAKSQPAPPPRAPTRDEPGWRQTVLEQSRQLQQRSRDARRRSSLLSGDTRRLIGRQAR